MQVNRDCYTDHCPQIHRMEQELYPEQTSRPSNTFVKSRTKTSQHTNNRVAERRGPSEYMRKNLIQTLTRSMRTITEAAPVSKRMLFYRKQTQIVINQINLHVQSSVIPTTKYQRRNRQAKKHSIPIRIHMVL